MPSSAAIAPCPTGTASCMARPRVRSSRAVSVTDREPAAASAEYSPSEWPATKAAASARRTPSSSSARSVARLTAISAGCALAVSLRRSSPPFQMISDRLSPSALSTSSKTAPALR